MNEATRKQLESYLDKCESELDRVTNFWLTNSHDDEHGGFFVCLGRDGKVYDETKYCWLQGRQVWSYCKLYNNIPKYHTEEILNIAKRGGEFLMKYVKNPENYKCFFAVTRTGEPIKIQRTIFSECFYMIAMAELARATGDAKYKTEAIAMMDHLQHWVMVDDTTLGRPRLSGSPPVNTLAAAMIFIILVEELAWDDAELRTKYAPLEEWSLKQTMQHIQRNGEVVLEVVSTEGNELPGSQGRVMNPGHAIETGWFLLQFAKKRNRPELRDIAISQFMVKPFLTGWDKEDGGIFYFLDADGLSPTQLEWNMKLWWPHNEALIAFLMAYRDTREQQYLDYFQQVWDYTMKHFVDPDHGGWYGYLSKQGVVSQDFKGGPWKGFFHVPRCLFMCIEMLKDILK
ncbi:N-acylglucosamine 2-epimerase-like [Lytechinus variegatus]|uniref:N-acylglucosamine 2-epimerase-like n=1 Tax=Lytechinus variegatus TaxID=7654 RepID=UPI001BB2C19A|nr:N-acylglucosamine 2-epimerase-like [Lytechinus variegatus]XP_041459513.1 N-acylglucosamine 2-epimerase-like [Lytechinus variegatus]